MTLPPLTAVPFASNDAERSRDMALGAPPLDAATLEELIAFYRRLQQDAAWTDDKCQDCGYDWTPLGYDAATRSHAAG